MIGVIYWTGSGATEEMAKAIVKGIEANGKEALLKRVEEISVADALAQCESFAFGCPAMGDEVLEESAFDPWFTEIEGSLSGKKVALFGSYGWGTGVWMEQWDARTKEAGAEVVGTSMACGAPDDAANEECENLGKLL